MQRPEDTKLEIRESYVSDLEEQVKKKSNQLEEKIRVFENLTQFLQIIRENYSGFDSAVEQFNEIDAGFDIVILDNKIRFRINAESEESKYNS